MQPAKLGPHRPPRPARPQQPPGPPPAGMGVGPHGHRPATPALSESAPHPLRQPRTYLQGDKGLLDSGHGPGGRAPRRPEPFPGTPRIPEGAGRTEAPGAAAGQRGLSRRSCGDLALPSAPGRHRRRRRHFAFHSVSLPPHSLAGFPDVGISWRRLRGGRGLGASARLAAGSAPPAASLPPAVARQSACPPAASPPPRAAQVTRPVWWRQAPSSQAHSSISVSLFFICALSVAEYRIKDAYLKEFISQKETAVSCPLKPSCGRSGFGISRDFEITEFCLALSPSKSVSLRIC